MMIRRYSAAAAITLLCAAFVSGCSTTPPNSLATHKSERWNKDMAAFAASDATNRPPENCIVFVGSSSVRMWRSLQQDFPGYPVVNRGFGGSQLADSVRFAPQIITGYKPKQVVIYAGGNDINAGKAPEVVFGDFVALVKEIRKGAPDARIAFISSAPNPRRWEQVEKVKALNKLVQNYSARHHIDFINVFPLMLGADGTPRPEIFLTDRLHMNANGYAIWREAVLPYLRK